MTEDRALRELQRGSQEALSWSIRRYTPYVSTVIGNIIGTFMDRTDIEEVASDVFFTLWEHAGEIRTGSLRPWLGAVARNLAKNKLRQAGRELPLEDAKLSLEVDDLEDLIELQDLRQHVRRAVLELPQPDRELFLRHYYYGQSMTEIAEETGMKVSTVKTRLRRGREQLGRVLKDLVEEGGRYGI